MDLRDARKIHADMPETFFGQLKVPFTAQRL
jgi:hypothetical protein